MALTGYAHLSILFNLFINFGHLPSGGMQSETYLLSETSRVIDVNNYRLIAISPAISKLFKAARNTSNLIVSLRTINMVLGLVIRPGLCTNVLKQTVISLLH